MATNPVLKIKRGAGAPISLATGELAMDLTNKSLFIGTAEGVLAVGGENVFAKKTYVDGAVSSEQSARESADTTLTTNLNAEISRAQAAESANAAAISTEETARIAAVSAEQSARESADTTLDGKITVQKGRIDAILSAADADKDSFAEIISLINSVDASNDTTFAGYVTSNNAALAQEVSDRTAGDSALASDISDIETAATALAGRVTAAEADIVSNAGDIAAEESARIAAVSAEASARSSAITTVQGNIDAEASTRASADTSLSGRLDTLEAVNSGSRLGVLESDVADHESRLSALESVIDGGSY